MAEEIHEIAEPEPEQIRQQIDETRSAITEKLEALENTVTGTVQNAKETVQETIDNVKETVQETVSTVKDTLNLRLQVERYPWPMLGGSLVAGFVTGALIGEARRRRHMPMDELASNGRPLTEYREPEYRRPEYVAPAAAEPKRPGLMDRFHTEIDQLKGMAIGYLLGAVRDAIKENVPQYAEQIREVMDNITTKLGGDPVRGPVLPQPTSTPPRQMAL